MYNPRPRRNNSIVRSIVLFITVKSRCKPIWVAYTLHTIINLIRTHLGQLYSAYNQKVNTIPYRSLVLYMQPKSQYEPIQVISTLHTINNSIQTHMG